MIDEADRDGDGEIGEEDFIRIMKKSNLFWQYNIIIFKNSWIIINFIFSNLFVMTITVIKNFNK
jgi:hypothetical protein